MQRYLHRCRLTGSVIRKVLLCYGPWDCQDWQFEILLFLIGELRASLKDKDERSAHFYSILDTFESVHFITTNNGHRFLIDCAMWMGEGRHLDLLDCILRGGFDPSLINSPVFEQWPVGCSSGWICEQVTPDPFFVEYLAMITHNNEGLFVFIDIQAPQMPLLTTPKIFRVFIQYIKLS